MIPSGGGPQLAIHSHGNPVLRLDLADPSEFGLTGGIGGWSRISRPKRRSLTDWMGQDGYEQTIAVLIDGFFQSKSVERTIARLEKLGRKAPDHEHPPILTLRGPVPHTDLLWVLQGIEWGAFERRGDGQRIRQFATLTFWEYVDADLAIQRKKSPAKDAQGRQHQDGNKSGSSKFYIVKRGDTLPRIAAKKLGDSSRWREIADLNDIRDPKAIKVGQRLRLP